MKKAILAALAAVGLCSWVVPSTFAIQTPSPSGAPITLPQQAESIATDRIKDLAARLVVKETNKEELRKMGGAFGSGAQYSIRRMNVSYQNPNKARFEGKLLGATVLLVYNGDDKMFKIPGRKETKNVHGQPGQKQSLMDLGIFARDYLLTDYQPNYVRTEKGNPGLRVFKLSQRNTTNTSHEVVYVNPKTAIIERRLSYNGDNVFQKEIRFVNPVQIRPGIWVPTRIEIYNQEGKLAVAQALEEIKVNLGVDASLFATS